MKNIYRQVNIAYHKKEKVDFDRELANDIWLKLKGQPIPEHWDDKQIDAIIKRYWTRAIAYSEGYS